MFLLQQLYLLVFKLFLAGKDAQSYLLKDKSANGSLTNNRIKRWHRDGVILDILGTLPWSYMEDKNWWHIIVASILLRLTVFDLAFNHYASLSLTHLGSTAGTDIFFAKIFGQNGAIKKSLFFFFLLVLFNILILIV